MHEVLIIGGGPAGLTAAMYCRMRKMSVRVVDAGRPGGQLVSLYGDKPVHDWPGYHHIIAGELAGQLVEHARQLEVEIAPNRNVTALVRVEDGFDVASRDVVTGDEGRDRSASVIVAIGGGAFEPRRLKVAGEEALDEDSLTYRMPDRSRAAGRDVVVVGGGDSGLESAQSARQAGARVTIVQVLERFTGMESNIDLVNDLGIPRRFNTRIKGLEIENGRLRALIAQTKGESEPARLPCDYLVVNIGAAVNLDAVKQWGIEVEGNQIKVDGHMRTSVEGVFACGDIVTYDGKYKLLLTASSEGCVAANSAYLHVRKPARVTMGDLYT
ncbi:MAG: NAD(P)/FAD-dependent oxidoreductase [Candidatus Eisenbacteria bacterium]|nr:NAD(P)/FAD-dependent oxidoreductase [Candidatus Eisenbacteria bacterium]